MKRHSAILSSRKSWLAVALLSAASVSLLSAAPAGNRHDGRHIFRYDTFGDEQLWTDVLRMHEVVQAAVSPKTALSVGLKVDSEALPPNFLARADLDDPATTVELLRRNAVVGIVAKVEDRRITSLGVTCALCHSTVDDSVAPGVGKRLDGWPNLQLDPGAIIALSPAVPAAQKAYYNSWGPGRHDPRFSVDGQTSGPVVIPPAYGLQGIPFETFTGDGPVSYWNNYVAVTQMGGQGHFADPRLGIEIAQDPDLVVPKLPALLSYQLSLPKPAAPAGTFDAAAAARGQEVFASAGCASCHIAPTYTDVQNGANAATPLLHDAAETGMDPAYAQRSATGKYRTTPLRALWQHAPYFHDGSAATLADVVTHYETAGGFTLTPAQKADLVEFLKSL